MHDETPCPRGGLHFCRPSPQVGLHRPHLGLIHLGLHAGLPGSTFLRRPMDMDLVEVEPLGGADGAAPLLPATLDEELQTTPVTRFLVPLGLGQHRDVFKQLGFDDPADFAAQSPADAADMKAALLESVPLGHVQRVMRRTAEMTGAAAQRLQPGPEQQSAASTTLLQSEERVEPSWALAIASPASSSPALPGILQSSLDEATRRRDKEHANKVARALATHRPLLLLLLLLLPLLLLKLQLLLLLLLLHPHPFTHQFKPASACLPLHHLHL